MRVPHAGVGHAPSDGACISREWVNEALKGQSPDAANSLKPSRPFKRREGFPF